MKNEIIVLKTVEYIEEHLEKEINLNEISEKMNYSKFHLNRMFAEKVGCTIYKYIQMRRLTEAAKKLAEGGQPIVEIAYEANYHSQQSFTFAFRQMYLCTPQVYRGAGVFYPKQTRYTMNNKRVLYGNTVMRCGGIAA